MKKMRSRTSVPDLGPLEFKILKILWKIQPATAREVLEEHNGESGRELKYTTVMTLLTRLSEKGVLSVDRERQPYQFVSTVSREQMLRQRLLDFVDLFFDGRPVELALRLVEDSELSEESIRRLEERLRRSREADPARGRE